MKDGKEKKTGLLIAVVVVAGLALSGIAVVRDGPQGLGMGRPEALPVAGATGAKPNPSTAKGQPIDVSKPDLTPEQRQGSGWTSVPATPMEVPRVRYADGEPVRHENVSEVLGWEGRKVRNPRAGDSDDGTMTPFHEPMSADQFWEGLTSTDGSPADVAPIPGR